MRYYDLSEHNTEFNNGWYTYTKRPVILKYYETTNDIKQAILRDKQLKGWGKKKERSTIFAHQKEKN
jgi:putative endonuclease